MTVTITHLWRYPVKGLSPEALDAVDLTPGNGLPGDRAYALAHGNTPFEPARPEWLPKHNFLMLAKNPRLAALATTWDDAAQVLTISRDGRQVARGALQTPVGRAMIAEFLGAYLKDEVRGTPRVVTAEGHMFSDHKERVVSIINAASLRDLGRVAGMDLDPLRFRANLMVEGLPAWAEFDLVGQEITVGGVHLRVKAPIDRCPATSADPQTGKVEINLPKVLKKGYGHINFGVYAEVLSAGRVAVGDVLAEADRYETD